MEKMIVSKINNGIVVDHVTSGNGVHISLLLKSKLKDHRIVILQNANSGRMGKKDLIKMENVKLDNQDLRLISLFAPKATINFVEGGEVARKEQVERPEVVEGLIQCPNARCITNDLI